MRHVALDSGRPSTWTSGLGIARIVRAIAADTGEVFPASIGLQGEYGIEGVCLSVPVAIGADGARGIEECDLTAEQQAGLQAGAGFVRAAAESIGGVRWR